MRNRPWWILLVLPLVPLWRAVFLGQAIGPWDQIRFFAPWMGGKPNQPWDVLQADGALQFYVWRDLVFESWSKFQVPLWNHYELAGTPLLANSQSRALYPPHNFMGVLHIPTPWAITLLAWFHLAWAGVGTYMLTRKLGANEMGAFLAGASFVLCPFMVSWTALASVTSTVSWIPWILLLTMDLTSGEHVGFNRRSTGLLALCCGMMLLAGHLQFAAYGFLALAIIAVARVKSAGAIGAAQTLIAVACGIAIAAPQLGPVLGYSQFSHRKTTATAEGYAAYASSAIRPFEFGNLVNPLSLGDPRGAGLDAHISSYWPPVVKPGGNFAESALSPGAVAVVFLCLLPIARRKLKPALGVIAVGLVGLLLATGSPLAQAMYFGIPGWASTGSPGRAIVLFVLAACILAGIAASSLVDEETRPKNPRAIQLGAMLFVFVTAGTLGIGAIGAKTPEGVEHEAFQALVGSASAGGVILTMVVAALAIQPVLLSYFRYRGINSNALIGLCLAVLVACCAMTGGDKWIMTGTLPTPVKMSTGGTFDRYAFVNAGWDMMMVPAANLPPNLAALYRIHELGGYDSLLHRDTVGMLREVNGGKDPAPPENGNMMFVKRQATAESIAEAGATWVVLPEPVNAVAGEPINQVFQAVPGPGRASVNGQPAKITAETFSSVTVEATGPGKLVLRDRMMPGWTASIDGVASPLPEGKWRELDLAGGIHKVQFQYQPRGFMSFLIIGVVGWLASLLAVLVRTKQAGSTN